jgi:hypothetical protein
MFMLNSSSLHASSTVQTSTGPEVHFSRFSELDQKAVRSRPQRRQLFCASNATRDEESIAELDVLQSTVKGSVQLTDPFQSTAKV